MLLRQNDSRIFYRYQFYVFFAFLFTGIIAFGQDTSDSQADSVQKPPTQQSQPPLAQQPGVLAPGKTNQGEDKYIFGVLPNYRTAEMNAAGHPLTPHQKLAIATKDSFAPTLIYLGLAYAALYQIDDSHPEFGQGLKGYTKRFATSYSDQVIGNFMTEGILPSLLKQDPRYFRMSHGTVSQRTWYAVSRIFVTRSDAGKKEVNWSELAGNATAAGIGLSYYPDNRNVPDYLENWGTQLGTDAVSQIAKEFWPDVKRWLRKRHGANRPMTELPPAPPQ